MATCGCDGVCGCPTTAHFDAAQPSEATILVPEARPPQEVLQDRIAALESAIISLGKQRM